MEQFFKNEFVTFDKNSYENIYEKLTLRKQIIEFSL